MNRRTKRCLEDAAGVAILVALLIGFVCFFVYALRETPGATHQASGGQCHLYRTRC
jgi:hypothetical protein